MTALPTTKSKFSLTSNQLKIIAIAVMFLDHFVVLFLGHDTPLAMALRIPGRLAAPIFCFLIAEGFHHTSNPTQYLKRLLIFAAISHVPYILCFGYFPDPSAFAYGFFSATSIMWPLSLGLVALLVMKNNKTHVFLRILVLFICCVLAYTANWNYIAVLWVFAFGLFYGNKKHQLLAFSAVGILHLIVTAINFGVYHDTIPHYYQLAIFLAIPLLLLYNGKRGRKSKALTWFFYLSYPLHMLILWVLVTFTTLPSLFN